MIDNPAERSGPMSLEDHRHTRTRRHIDDAFADGRTAREPISGLLVSIEDWRAHARAAAKSIGRNVKTGIGPNRQTVWARLVPIPTPPPVVSEHPSGLRLFTNRWMLTPFDYPGSSGQTMGPDSA